MDRNQTCKSIIDGLDELLTVANENYSDMSQFFEDPERYLDGALSKSKDGNEPMYTAPLSTGGETFLSIDKACTELIKVNAYTEVLYIYQTFLDHLESIREGLSKADVQNINGTIDVIKSRILSTMKTRDDYTSLRKATLAKYSAIVNEMK